MPDRCKVYSTLKNEKFIGVCLEYSDLDLCHYFNSPGLSSDAMLKMNGVDLELVSDIDMYLFVEKGMRWYFLYLPEVDARVEPILNT